jgi:hypothetical protein
MSNKYIICCDFDGVLHSYTSGWKGAAEIPDPPVPGAMEWLALMTSDEHFPRFEIAVYSSRSKEPGGIEAISAWLRQHLLGHFVKDGVFRLVVGEPVQDLGPEKLAAVEAVMSRLTFPTQKPAASMTIDDRAFHFQGRFPEPEALLDFQPWTKKKQDPMQVFLDGVQIHPDLVVAVHADKGEVTVLLPIAKRTMGIGPDYVPIIEPATETSPGVWAAGFHTITLTGKVEVRSVND